MRLFAPPDIEKFAARGDVGRLIKALGHESSPVRDKATDALKEMGEPAVEPLIAALADENPRVRARAVYTLAAIDGRRAVEPLIAALGDESSEVRASAAWNLGDLGDHRAVEPLIAALEDPAAARFACAMSLGTIGDPRALEPLLLALTDEDSQLRKHAARALGGIGDARAVEPLLAALDDEDREVRGSAATALGMIGDPRAVEPLLALEHDAAEGGSCEKLVLLQATGALARLDTPEARRLRDEASARQEQADAAIENLVAYSKSPFADEMRALMDTAASQLRAAGWAGQRALARFIRELLDCRSPDVDVPLYAARRIDASPELLEAIRAVQTAPPTTVEPVGPARFDAEIRGAGTIGWTDATAKKLAQIARETLAAASGAASAGTADV
jgi:HEAT repeat protein